VTTVAQGLAAARQRLAASSDSAALDGELLLGAVLGLGRAQLLAQGDRLLTGAEAAAFETLLARRQAGEPVAYLTGSRGFWTLELRVTPAVLVPRPETELLVEVALAFLEEPGEESRLESRSHRDVLWERSAIATASRCYDTRVLELGTGSGAVAIALSTAAAARGLALRVTATDLSERALQVAAANARRHATAIEWLHGDWWQPVRGRFRLIVSNPPYVRASDPHLPALRHEPPLALTAGADGLEAISRIIGGAADHLDHGGMLALEHGWDQAAAVRDLLQGAGFTEVASAADLAGHERVTRGRLTHS
jgi:release factor glutamine methyltransferase